jgi:hypothetical protein
VTEYVCTFPPNGERHIVDASDVKILRGLEAVRAIICHEHGTILLPTIKEPR